MPSTSWPIWFLTIQLLVWFPVLNFIYWPYVLESGILPPDSDGIGVPMVGSVFVAILASPVVLSVSWLCLRRYNPNSRILGWHTGRRVRSVVATTVLGLPATLLTIGFIAEIRRDWPWYEYLWTVYGLPLAAWLLALRAAITHQLPATRKRTDT